MGDLPLHKVAIPGPTLASLMQRITCSLEDVDGLLFGHVNSSTVPILTDDSSLVQSDPSLSEPQITATVTSFLLSGPSNLSFFDSIGCVLPSLNNLLSYSPSNHRLLGWFSGRRKSPLRPSMREFSVCHSLSSVFPYPSDLNSSHDYRDKDLSLPPCVLLLFSTPIQSQMIHTHEYRAYQYRPSTFSIEPRSVEIVNIGPAFRGHYESFSPSNSEFFPRVPLMTSSVVERNAEADELNRNSLKAMKEEDMEQKVVDRFALGFKVQNLKQLVGIDSSSHTMILEDMYHKMLDKVESLSREVETGNAKILSQEILNRGLRYKISNSGKEQRS